MRTTRFLLAASASLAITLAAFGQASQEIPSAPAPQAAAAAPAAPQFPPQDPRNFTAAAPTRDTVDAFLRQTWGYDPDRSWQVQAIQQTSAPGVSKVVVLVAEKNNPQEPGSLVFFTTPDGGYLIANDVLPFGAHPFDARRQVLQAAANGPSRGAAAKTLMLVEFADFQCPHCKEVQPTVAKLLLDFPEAHFVYENFPLVSIHSEAYKAAAYSVCVAKQNGNEAFFRFAEAAYANQAQLTPDGSTQALGDAATKAGADPAKVAACSTSAEAKEAVDASLKLGRDLGVDQTPTLFVNGRNVPMGGLAYEQLKQIVTYQMSLDK
jgi:protein-disulfide isomerase